MTYSVIRRRGTEETATQSSEAITAIGILRAWSVAFPQQYLLIRDEYGAPLAYRRPHTTSTSGALPHYTL